LKAAGNVWARRAGLLAVSGALLVANLAFFLWYRSTTRQRQQALESRRVALERDVEGAEAEAVRLARQRERLLQVTEALNDFYQHRVGSRRETLAPLIDDLHGVLRRIGIFPAQITYASVPLKDLPLSELKISFSFKNDYGRFKQLVAAFESSRRWIVVHDVALARDTDAPGSVQVRMQLSAYFIGEEKPIVRAATAAPRGRVQ
jgi:Tfp pilus assembly protein PilO